MDIIITGEQGAGKTTAAETIIKNFRPPYGQRYSDADVLYIHDAYWTPGTLLTEMLRAARVRAVVFDGCITNPGEMLAAVAAVKKYREQIKTDILAIYVAQGDAVMITDGERKPYPRNEFKRTPIASATSNDGENWVDGKPYVAMNKTDKILVDLWDTVADNATEAQAEEMTAKLAGLTNGIETPGLHHLSYEGKITLHEFLIKLLREQG